MNIIRLAMPVSYCADFVYYTRGVENTNVRPVTVQFYYDQSTDPKSLYSKAVDALHPETRPYHKVKGRDGEKYEGWVVKGKIEPRLL